MTTNQKTNTTAGAAVAVTLWGGWPPSTDVVTASYCGWRCSEVYCSLLQLQFCTAVVSAVYSTASAVECCEETLPSASDY